MIHIEQQWQENLLTTEGRQLHVNAHDPEYTSTVQGKRILRAMPVRSYSLGLTGECDIVEYDIGQDGKLHNPIPIEYKHGRGDDKGADSIQLCAQAMCLEEMSCTTIQYGFIYYGTIRRRIRVDFSDELKKTVMSMALEMQEYYRRQYTPRVKASKKCTSCSLRDLCLPGMLKKTSAYKYVLKELTSET